MTLLVQAGNERARARPSRWRVQPVRQILYAWAGLLWAAPIVSILAIAVASAAHAWEHNYAIGRFFGATIYTTFSFVLFFSWNIIPLTLAIVSFAAHRTSVLRLFFWCTIILAHLFRFAAAHRTYSIFFEGLTGPGIGPSFDVLCPADADAPVELAIKCTELANIERSCLAATASVSLVFFALEVRRMNVPRIESVRPLIHDGGMPTAEHNSAAESLATKPFE